MTATAPVTMLAELPLRTGRWQIDHPHSAILFSIRHLGLAKVRGRFDRFEATLDVGPTLAETRVEATIDLDSIDTNNDDRDAHLRSTDFFSTEIHPTMRFVSTGLTGAVGDWQLSGQLTLNGVTRPIILDVEFNGVQEFPGRDVRHVGFSATGSLRRSEFGIEFGMLPLNAETLALGDEVKIELDLEFVEPRDWDSASPPLFLTPSSARACSLQNRPARRVGARGCGPGRFADDPRPRPPQKEKERPKDGLPPNHRLPRRRRVLMPRLRAARRQQALRRQGGRGPRAHPLQLPDRRGLPAARGVGGPVPAPRPACGHGGGQARPPRAADPQLGPHAAAGRSGGQAGAAARCA